MQTSSWYTSKPAIVLYHVLTWIVTLFLPYIMRTILDEKREANFGAYRGGFQNERRWQPDSAGLARRPAAGFGEGRPPHAERPPFPGEMPDSLRRGDRPFRTWDRPFPPRAMMDPKFFSHLAMVLNLVWIALFYVNAYWLIPRYIRSKKWARYALLQLLFFIAVSFLVSGFLEWYMGEDHLRIPMPLLLNIFPFFFIQAGSLAYRLIVDRIHAEKLLKEKENEGLKTELSFLRSQISPHFIFNVLNNLVSLARKKSDQLEPGLIRLSGLLRYMLYESDGTKVKLSRELDYLRSYIDLQSLRFGNDVDLRVDLQTPMEEYFIEPMLLIPFVENAFKHSASYMNRPVIEVKAAVRDGILHFSVDNQFEPGMESASADKVPGIGLANVRRRLNLLYGARHQLSISDKDGFYRISLQITLA